MFGKLKVNKQLSSNLIVSKCNHCTGCRRTCECQNCEGSWEKYRNKVKVRFSTKQKTQLVCWWMCEDLKVTRDGVVRSQLPEVSWWRMCENCEELKLTRDGVVSSQRSKNSPKYWWMKGPQPKDEDSNLENGMCENCEELKLTRRRGEASGQVTDFGSAAHLKTYSGEKSNKCNQCDFADNFRTHLKMHI